MKKQINSKADLEAVIKKAGSRRGAMRALKLKPSPFYYLVHKYGLNVDAKAAKFGALAVVNAGRSAKAKAAKKSKPSKAKPAKKRAKRPAKKVKTDKAKK